MLTITTQRPSNRKCEDVAGVQRGIRYFSRLGYAATKLENILSRSKMASPGKIKEFCDNPDVDPGLDPYTREFIVRIATYVISTAQAGSPNKDLAERMLNTLIPSLYFKASKGRRTRRRCPVSGRMLEKKPRINVPLSEGGWRATSQTPCGDNWVCDVIQPGVKFYRGAGKQSSRFNLYDRATYYTPRFQVANLYINKTKESIVQVVTPTKELRLFRIDCIENANRLLRESFASDKKLYECMTTFYGLVRKQDMKEDGPVQITSLERLSGYKNDFFFANWLCRQGMAGYSAGPFTGNFKFPAEVVICEGIFNLEIKGLVYTKKINTEADMKALDEKICEDIPMHY